MAELRQILLGYDGFERGTSISSAALELARRHGAKLRILHVAPPEPSRGWKTTRVSSQELHDALVASRRRRLEDQVANLQDEELDVEVRIRSGDPHVELIREAISMDADLIVVSDDAQEEDGRRGFGVVTAKLLRKSPIPVLAHRDHESWKPKTIVAALDVEPRSEQDDRLNLEILATAEALARASGAGLVVFHAWRLWGEELLRSRTDESEFLALLADTEAIRRGEIDRLLRIAGSSDLEVRIEIQKGDAERLLVALGHEGHMDVLVMGTLRRAGLPGFVIGHTAERIINRLPCDIVALKPPDFVTPIDP